MADTAFGLTVPNYLLFQITTLYLILFVKDVIKFVMAFSSHPKTVKIC